MPRAQGRIDATTVDAELDRLRRTWPSATDHKDGLDALLPDDKLNTIDPFDRVQLAHVVSICRRSRTLSEAGRTLFSASRQRRASTNDADRLRKYLARFRLTWETTSSLAQSHR